jgi:hypothetical protein
MNRLIHTLFCLLLFVSVNGQAPAPSGFPSPYSTGYYRIGWNQSDSGNIPAYRDTNWIPKFQGTFIFWMHSGVDSALWYRLGNKWVKLLKNGDVVGGVSSFNTRTGSVTLTSSDIQTALGGNPLLNITGYIQAGTNVSLTGLGTQASPYVINSSGGGGGGSVTQFNFTNGNGITGIVTNPNSTPTLALGTTLNGIVNANGSGFGTVTVGSGLNYSGGVLTATGGTSLSGLISGNGSIFTTTNIGAGLSYSGNTLTNTITNTNQLTNGSGFITNITGLISAGSNVTITGSGTSGSPYVINSTASGGGGGTVTTVSAGNLAPLFITSVSNPSTIPGITFSLSNASPNSVFGNNTGSSAAPTYYVPNATTLNGWFGGNIQSQLSGTGYLKQSGTSSSYLTPTQVTADLNVFSSSLQGLVPASGGGSINFLRADGTWASPPAGTVTSVGMTVPSFLSVSGSPITGSGTFGVTLATQTAYTGFGNWTGSTAAPTFGKIPYQAFATGPANYTLGYDGSGNPTQIAPRNLYIKKIGSPGDSLLRIVNGVTDDSLYNPAIRDSLAFHHVINPDGSWTLYASSGFSDPLTTNGDIIARISGVTTRLGQGGNNTFLGVQGGALGYYAAFSLTTTGTSGASTFTGGALNIPQYQGQLTLTTTGTSGAATLIGNTLNIPQYSGGGGGVNVDASQTITSGSSITVTNGNNIVVFNPSAALSSFALTAPATPHNGNYLILVAGGVITSGTVVGSFSFVANTGQTIVGPPPTEIMYGQTYIWKYVGTTWYRQN